VYDTGHIRDTGKLRGVSFGRGVQLCQLWDAGECSGLGAPHVSGSQAMSLTCKPLSQLGAHCLRQGTSVLL